MPSSKTASEIDLIQAVKDHGDRNAVEHYHPYPKQKTFHEAGLRFRERAMMANNRGGKTTAACAEDAYHLTGDYPDWWEGKRFSRPITLWAIGQAGHSSRDSLQECLMGDMYQWGTGMIPKDRIDKINMSRGLPGSIDTVFIKHRGGKLSKLQFKQCEQGLMKLAGAKVDVVHCDEQPPEDVYSEALMRTRGVEGGGIAYTTFTPLQGRGGIVDRFWPTPNSVDRHLTMMAIDECPHFIENPDEMRAFIESLAPWEVEARTKGVPTMGSGRVFTTLEADIAEDAIDIPKHWERIAGLDFGWNHPTAAAWIAIEPTGGGPKDDILHVYDAYRRTEADAEKHAVAIKQRGPWIPIAWPHDGMQHDKGSGIQVKEHYVRAGLKMLPKHATFPDGSFGVRAGLLEMHQRFESGRLRIAKHLFEVFEEYRNFVFDRDDKLVKVDDDLLAAIRYAMMMRRFAKAHERRVTPRTVGLDYEPLAHAPGSHTGRMN